MAIDVGIRSNGSRERAWVACTDRGAAWSGFYACLRVSERLVRVDVDSVEYTLECWLESRPLKGVQSRAPTHGVADVDEPNDLKRGNLHPLTPAARSDTSKRKIIRR